MEICSILRSIEASAKTVQAITSSEVWCNCAQKRLKNHSQNKNSQYYYKNMIS